MSTNKSTAFVAAREPEIHDAEGVMDHGSGRPRTVRGSGKAAPALWCMATLAGMFVAPLFTEAAGEFVWPVNGWLSATTVYPGGADHQGASADIAAPMWTAMGASRAGYSTAYWEGGGCGNYAWITHTSGYITLYCHLVQRPTTGSVGTNQTIGYIGVTGNTTGPHVHWAIRQWGVRKYVPGSYIGMRVSRGSYVAGNYGLSGTSGSNTSSGTTTSSGTSWVYYRIKINSGDGVNIRSGPGTGYSRVGGYNNGAIVDVYGVSGQWYKVWYGGAWRWIINTYSTRVLTSVRITSGDGVNVRSGPGTGYARVGGLNYNNHVAVFATSGGWYKIFYSGAYRWIISTYTAKL